MTGASFNPHPAFLPGDARPNIANILNVGLFQSAPGISAG